MFESVETLIIKYNFKLNEVCRALSINVKVNIKM